MSQAKIYALFDPRNGGIFYVGATTTSLKQRLSAHLCNAEDTEKYRLVREIVSVGMRPKIVTIEMVDDGSWEDAERRWIAQLRTCEAPLLNKANGGRGSSGVAISEEHRMAVKRGALRKTTTAKSGYRGVLYDASRRKWGAFISVDGKLRNLGRYDDATTAAKVYDAAAAKHFGSLATLNFPSLATG